MRMSIGVSVRWSLPEPSSGQNRRALNSGSKMILTQMPLLLRPGHCGSSVGRASRSQSVFCPSKQAG
jgi:hypothetical protein